MVPDFEFRGDPIHVLDDKGRLAVPNRFREELKKSREPEHMVAHFRHDDGCLAFYPVERWRLVEESVMNLETPYDRDLVIRHYLAPAEDIYLDKAGRILIPAKFRAQAELEREVVILGGLFKFEIWNQAKFACNQAEKMAEARDITKRHKIML